MELEQELVQCIMIVLNKPDGLNTLEASGDLLPVLAVSVGTATRNVQQLRRDCSLEETVCRM